MSTTPPKVILFDADGVTQVSGRNFREDLAALVESQNVSEFINDVFSAEKPCLTGKRHFPDELSQVLNKWSVDHSLDEVLSIWTNIEPVKFMFELIPELRREVRCCLATNQQQHRAGLMRESLGYDEVFDELFVSCELGFAKPETDFFHAILQRLELAPDEVGFLDDHPDNVKAAAETGIRSEHFVFTQGQNRLNEILVSWGIT